jgi:Kef-type K+ transport system membrane component KefB
MIRALTLLAALVTAVLLCAVTGAWPTHLPGLAGSLVAVVLLARAFGALAVRMGQPAVVGELVGGLIIGPSLLGRAVPGLSDRLLPDGVLPGLTAISEVGLLFFMFLVGLEINPAELRRGARQSSVLATANVATSFLAGLAIAPFVVGWMRPDPGVDAATFAVFLGVVMAITAMPVLARVLDAHSLIDTRLGAVAITGAAANDVVVWVVLGTTVTLHLSGGLAASVLTMSLMALVLALVVAGMRWHLNRQPAGRRPRLRTHALVLSSVTAVGLAASGAQLDFLGTLLLGILLPRHPALTELRAAMRGPTVRILLPPFFAVVGMQSDLFATGGAVGHLPWWLLLFVAFTAVKPATAYVVTRSLGEDRHFAASLGVLMNCRGVSELAVLGLGLELGFLAPESFTVFVLFALLSTVSTSPLLSWVDRRRTATKAGADTGPAAGTHDAAAAPVAAGGREPQLTRT